VRTWSGLAEHYRNAVQSFPGLAEPFVVVAPDSIGHEPLPLLLDDGGRALPLSDDERMPGELDYWDQLLSQRASAGHMLWLSGRLLDHDNLSLLPLSAGTTLHNTTLYSRA